MAQRFSVLLHSALLRTSFTQICALSQITILLKDVKAKGLKRTKNWIHQITAMIKAKKNGPIDAT